MPYTIIAANLTQLYTSADGTDGILHWHIGFREAGQRLEFLLSPGQDNLDVSRYLLDE